MFCRYVRDPLLISEKRNRNVSGVRIGPRSNPFVLAPNLICRRVTPCHLGDERKSTAGHRTNNFWTHIKAGEWPVVITPSRLPIKSHHPQSKKMNLVSIYLVGFCLTQTWIPIYKQQTGALDNSFTVSDSTLHYVNNHNLLDFCKIQLDYNFQTANKSILVRLHWKYLFCI